VTRGQLAVESGVNLETIRYYETRGVIPKAPRSASGYRVFSQEAVTRLRFVKRAQDLGFSLTEIKELLSLRVKPGVTCDEVRNKAQAKIGDVEEKIRQLQQIRSALAELLSNCSGSGPINTCTILQSLNNGEVS
jgi:MerR family copper efflux transcriptional regulator